MIRIALSMRVVEAPGYSELRDAVSQDWIAFISREVPEIVPVLLPNHPGRVRGWMEDLRIDGAILTNGNDLGSDPGRDETERIVTEYCLDNDLPIAGFCRGFQLLNDYFGGTVRKLTDADGEHVACSHFVEFENGPGAARLQTLAAGARMKVNSYHNFGVRQADLAEELESFARAGDLVEGFFHPARNIIGVQWHPERPGSSLVFDRALIRNCFLEQPVWLIPGGTL